MIEILSVDVSKNPVVTSEKFIISVGVRPYFTVSIGIGIAVPTLICSSIKAKPAGYVPINKMVTLNIGSSALEIVKIKN